MNVYTNHTTGEKIVDPNVAAAYKHAHKEFKDSQLRQVNNYLLIDIDNYYHH